MSKTYYKKNRDAVLIKAREYYKNNRELLKECVKILQECSDKILLKKQNNTSV